jgi:Cys-tRNA(Pro) deacylase
VSDDPGRIPDTPALRALAGTGLDYRPRVSARAGSVAEAAELRGVAVDALLKTLVVRRGESDYLFVLVPGDRAIDWGKLRSQLGVRRMTLPDAAEAKEATGYERGTITPFGATRRWPVIADETIAAKGEVSLGGGAHGVSVTLSAASLIDVLDATVADVTKPVEG